MKRLVKLLIVITLLIFFSETAFSLKPQVPEGVLKSIRDITLGSDKAIEIETTGNYEVSFSGKDETGPYVDKIKFDGSGNFLEVVSPPPIPERIYKRLEKISIYLKIIEMQKADAKLVVTNADTKVKTEPLSDKIYLPISSIEKINLLRVLPIYNRVLIPDKLFAENTNKGEVILKDIATYRILAVLPDAGYASKFSPDGKLLTTHLDNTITLWDVSKIRDSGKAEKLYSLTSGKLINIIFSPDGKFLAVAEENGKNKLYDVATGKEMWTHKQKGYSLAFSPDGKILAMAGGRKAAILIDVITGKEIKSLEYPKSMLASYSHYYDPWTVSFGPDGKLATLGLSCPDNNVGCKRLPPSIWDIATGKLIKTLINQAESLAFSPDGRFLVTWISSYPKDRPAILYDIAKDTEIPFGSFKFANFIKFSSDSKVVCVGDEIWSLEGFAIAEFFKKDEFETTKEYEQRVKGIKRPYSTKISLGRYDADRGGFEIVVAGIKAFVPVEREKAKEIAANKDTVYISGDLIYAREDILQLVDARLELFK